MTQFLPYLQAISAVLTIGTLSFLYGENPYYRWAEYTVIGIATGNWLMMAINAIQNAALGSLLAGEYHVIIALILGVLYFSRFWGMPWLYRYPIATLTGIGLGLMIRGQPGVVIKNIVGVMWPMTADVSGIGAVLGALSLILGLSYFTYTKEHKGFIGGMAKTGRYFIMAFIGQRFVGEVSVYITVLIGRLSELVNYLLGRGI